MIFQINHLQHIGLPVTSLECSEAFYNRLGFKNIMAAHFDFNGDRGHVKMLQHKNIILELYQMPAAELEAIKLRGNGHIDHFAFDVSDIDLAFNELKAEGFIIDEPAPVFLNFWSNGCKYFNVIGPDGERVEFNQIL